MRYFKGTPNHGLKFKSSREFSLRVADAHWASNFVDRHSWTGFAFLLGGASISWGAEKHRTVAISSADSEYVSLEKATKEALHLKRVLQESRVPVGSVVICNDSQSAQGMVQKAWSKFEKIKHIGLRYFFPREELNCCSIDLNYIETSIMPADVLIKALGGTSNRRCIDSLGGGLQSKKRFNFEVILYS